MPKTSGVKRGRSKASPPSSSSSNATSTACGSYCRVCANWCPDQSAMIPLDSRTIHRNVCTPAEAIMAIGGSAEREHNELPRFCCAACFGQLGVAYGVRKMCRESELKLRHLLVKDVPEEILNPLMAVEVVCNAEDTEDVEIKMEPDDNDGDNYSQQSVENNQENSNEESESAEQSKPKRLNSLISKEHYEEVQAVAFRCCGCFLPFETQVELYEHGQVEHSSKKLSREELGSRVQCEICYKTLCNSSQLGQHRKHKVHYRCKTCGETFINRIRMSTHYRTIHGPNATVSGTARICCGCAEQLPSPEALSAHSEAVHLPNRPPPNPERPFVCDICYHNFPTDQTLYAHKTRLTSKIKKYVCATCGKQFRYPGMLSDHEKTHLGEKVFQCTECPAAYVSRESLRKHVLRHKMPKDKFKCAECGRCYRSARNLKDHMNLHTGEKPFVCTYEDCSASFARDTSLAVHILTHTGQKDHECSICGKRFSDNNSLRAHVNFHHKKERPFGCFFCERRYPRKDYRKRHMENAHAAELAANPLPAIELAGSTRWLKKE